MVCRFPRSQSSTRRALATGSSLEWGGARPSSVYPLDALAGKVDFVAHARLLRGTEERGQKVNDIIRNIVSFVIISFGITLLFRTIRGHQRPDALEDLGAREWLRYLQVV